MGLGFRCTLRLRGFDKHFRVSGFTTFGRRDPVRIGTCRVLLLFR